MHTHIHIYAYMHIHIYTFMYLQVYEFMLVVFFLQFVIVTMLAVVCCTHVFCERTGCSYKVTYSDVRDFIPGFSFYNFRTFFPEFGWTSKFN